MHARILTGAFCGAFLLMSQSDAAEIVSVGGDLVSAGSNVEISQPSGRDTVASGFSVSLTGLAAGDVALAGFDLDIEAPVGDDLYAAGATIDIAHPVGGDITAAGFSVRLREAASGGGNARMVGANVTIDGRVNGALAAVGGTLVVNGAVGGDARLVGSEIRFGPNAAIGGNLVYRAPEPLAIPASVIPAERVSYERMDGSAGIADEVRNGFSGFWPSFASVLISFLVTTAFLTVAAALAFSFAPAPTEQLREVATEWPFRSIMAGLVALGALVGLIPVCVITLIGIPLIPLLALAIITAWVVGYLLGIYVIAWKLATSLSPVPESTTTRLAVVVVGIIVAATLNFIPFIGWLLNLLLVLLGMGALTIWLTGVPVAKTNVTDAHEELPAAL